MEPASAETAEPSLEQAAEPAPDQAAEAVPDQAVADELLAAISAVRRTTRRAARYAWQTEPLTPTQSELLTLAASRPGISVADAARELRLAPNTVSTLVGDLSAQDLLSRSRSAADGRSVRLSATAKARKRLGRWRDLRAELTGRVLSEMQPRDREALAAAIPALRRLAARMEEP